MKCCELWNIESTNLQRRKNRCSASAGGGIRARQKARRCLIHSRRASVYSEYPMSISQRADALRQRFALSSRPAIASFTISGVGLFLLKT